MAARKFWCNMSCLLLCKYQFPLTVEKLHCVGTRTKQRFCPFELYQHSTDAYQRMKRIAISSSFDKSFPLSPSTMYRCGEEGGWGGAWFFIYRTLYVIFLICKVIFKAKRQLSVKQQSCKYCIHILDLLYL